MAVRFVVVKSEAAERFVAKVPKIAAIEPKVVAVELNAIELEAIVPSLKGQVITPQQLVMIRLLPRQEPSLAQRLVQIKQAAIAPRARDATSFRAKAEPPELTSQISFAESGAGANTGARPKAGSESKAGLEVTSEDGAHTEARSESEFQLAATELMAKTQFEASQLPSVSAVVPQQAALVIVMLTVEANNASQRQQQSLQLAPTQGPQSAAEQVRLLATAVTWASSAGSLALAQLDRLTTCMAAVAAAQGSLLVVPSATWAYTYQLARILIMVATTAAYHHILMLVPSSSYYKGKSIKVAPDTIIIASKAFIVQSAFAADRITELGATVSGMANMRKDIAAIVTFATVTATVRSIEVIASAIADVVAEDTSWATIDTQVAIFHTSLAPTTRTQAITERIVVVTRTVTVTMIAALGNITEGQGMSIGQLGMDQCARIRPYHR